MNKKETVAIRPPVDEVVIAFCDDCFYLSCTEERQDAEYSMGFGRTEHKCNYHYLTLKHGAYHPRLPRPGDCNAYRRR